MSYETQFLISLLITLAVEVPIAVVLVKLFLEKRTTDISKDSASSAEGHNCKTPPHGGEQVSVFRIIGIGILATCLTIPYLWFIFNYYFSWWTMFIGGEICVFLVETIIYRKLLPIRLPKAVIISFVANVASILAGFIIQSF